jgi:predicted ABC-type ATPase
MLTALPQVFRLLIPKVSQSRQAGATLVTFVKATFSCFSSVILLRIHELMKSGVDFAFETTLATRSYVSLVKAAQQLGYKVTLLFIWLDSPETAIQRVADRVAEGGHNIPENVVERIQLMLKVQHVETNKSNKSELDELSDKIMQGMTEASRKLVEKSVATEKR